MIEFCRNNWKSFSLESVPVSAKDVYNICRRKRSLNVASTCWLSAASQHGHGLRRNHYIFSPWTTSSLLCQHRNIYSLFILRLVLLTVQCTKNGYPFKSCQIKTAHIDIRISRHASRIYCIWVSVSEQLEQFLLALKVLDSRRFLRGIFRKLSVHSKGNGYTAGQRWRWWGQGVAPQLHFCWCTLAL